MGKSEDQIKKRVTQVQKSPISVFWLGTAPLNPGLLPIVPSREGNAGNNAYTIQ